MSSLSFSSFHVGFIFAAEINGKFKLVVVGIIGGPQNGLISLLRDALRDGIEMRASPWLERNRG